MSLRARIVVVVLLVSCVPSAGLAWALRARLVTGNERLADVEEARAGDASRRMTARRWERRRQTSLAVDRLCDGDYVIDAVVADVGAQRFDGARRADLAARLPALARAQDLEILEILTAGGIVLGANVPGRPRTDLALLGEADRAGDQTFRLPPDERDFAGCYAGEGDARVLVVGAAPVAPELAPLRPGFNPPAFVFDGRAEAATELAAFDRTAGIALAVTALVALLLGLWVSSDVSRALRTVQLAAARIGQGATDSSHSGKPRGEVGKTLAALDAMTADLQKAQRRALRAERVAAWRDIARRIAHEIKNPLLPIQMSIETMRKTYAKKHPDFDEIFEESTLTILEEVARLSRIVDEFSRFARMPRPRAEVLDVRDVVAHVESLAPTGDVPLSVEVHGEPPSIRADREQLVQVLVNLAQNAADAARSKSPSDARVVVVVEPWEVGKGVVISIRDNGPGIPAAQRQAVFEPYYTTKTGGTGLGLAIVHRIVVDHRGTVEIDEARDGSGGAEVRVTLPIEGPGEAADSSMTDSTLL